MSVGIATPRYVDGPDGMDDFSVRPGLSWRAKREVRELLTISRGVMLVSGQPGSGKDLFGVSFCARQKYLLNRRILLDFAPKKAFGPYIPFDAQVMMREINKMAKMAHVEGIDGSKDRKEYEEFLGSATEKWALEGEGEVFLKGAILYLSELKRYCPNREPMNKFNRFIGSINSIWRHLDLLVMGTHVFPHEIDQYTYLQYAKLRAKCSVDQEQPDINWPENFTVTIARGAFIGARSMYHVEGRPLTFHINGRQPRPWLNNHSYFEIYQSKNPVNLKPVLTKEMQGG